MLSSIERVKKVLAGEWPDRYPVMLHNFMLNAREMGISMREYYSNPELAAKSHMMAAEKYGLDGIVWDIDTAVLASAVGVEIDFPENEPARTKRPLLKNLEEVDALEFPDVKKDDRVQIALEGLRILMKEVGGDLFIRANADQAPFSLASMMRGPVDFMTDLFVNPAQCHKLIRYCTIACKQFVELLALEKPHMISNGDSPAGPDMISPDMYREFALPYEKEIVAYSHKFELPYMLHICGNTDLILDDMKDSGLDAVELDYKTSIHNIHAKYKDNILFSGNIDPTGVIARGSSELVKDKTMELLDLYSDSPRFILNAGCAIPPMTPEENIRAMVETLKNYSLC